MGHYPWLTEIFTCFLLVETTVWMGLLSFWLGRMTYQAFRDWRKKPPEDETFPSPPELAWEHARLVQELDGERRELAAKEELCCRWAEEAAGLRDLLVGIGEEIRDYLDELDSDGEGSATGTTECPRANVGGSK